MGIEVPTNFKVLSADFKELFIEACKEINRLSNLYADINRLRAIVDRTSQAASKQSDVAFFRIGSGGETVDTIGSIEARVYQGQGFDLSYDNDGFSLVNEISTTAYDLSVLQNNPQTHPATQLTPDPIESGTVVMCKVLDGGVYVFCSVMPRLSVLC